MDKEESARLKDQDIKKKDKKEKKEKKKKKKDKNDSSDDSSDSEEENAKELEKKRRKEEQEKKEKEEKQLKTVYNDRFEIQPNRLIGKGSFGEIYVALDLQTRLYCALKLENSKNKNAQLKNERTVIELLKSCEGFPKLIEAGTQNDSNYMVIDLLGPNLSDLFEFCSQKFSLQTVLLIAIQMITRIQDLHSRNYIHRDIKPENFLIGVGKNSNTVYIIDFGLSKKYKDAKMDHMPYKEGKILTGTARYASINNHLGIEQSRRDDLEAIGYVLIYFLKKKLPWQGCQGSTKQEKYNKILEKKLTIPVEILCKDFPIEFSIYMNYCKNLKYNERPDYNFLKVLFIDLLYMHYNEKFLFDWTLPDPSMDAPNKKTDQEKGEIKDDTNRTKNKTPNDPFNVDYIKNNLENKNNEDKTLDQEEIVINVNNNYDEILPTGDRNNTGNNYNIDDSIQIKSERQETGGKNEDSVNDRSGLIDKSELLDKTEILDKTEVLEDNNVDQNELASHVMSLHDSNKKSSSKSKETTSKEVRLDINDNMNILGGLYSNREKEVNTNRTDKDKDGDVDVTKKLSFGK